MNITATLLAQMVAFVLLIWFVNRLLWGPVSKMLEERQKRIADGLAAGEKGRHELAMAEKRAKEVLHEAKSKAGEIIAQAEGRGSEIVEEAKTNAKVEGDRLLTGARAEVDKEVNRAREQLRSQVSAIAIAGASKVLGREINADSHADLLNDLSKQI